MLEEKTSEMRDIFMREGIFVKTAMTADINGISLGARDVLLNNGIEFLYTNIHTHPRNVSPLSEPECLFLGRRLRTQAARLER